MLRCDGSVLGILFSRGAVSQLDSNTYFDRLPLLRIAYWLQERGVDIDPLAAILQMQLLPQIVDARGGLTGSLLALLLSRLPIESSMIELVR